MKKGLYFLVLLFSSQIVMAQSPDCEFADPFCTDDGAYEFPASTDAGSAEQGPDYDCLGSEPNPAWYYMQISESGDLIIDMFSTPLVDIDFACWGPFSGLNGVCDSLTGDMVVDCSYSANPTETVDIFDAQVGDIYLLLITNFSNSACNITFEQTSGEGATDCSIVECFAEAGEDVEICDGDSTLLVGSGGETYTWFPTEGLSDPNAAETMAYPAETTWYFVTTETLQNTGDMCYKTDSVLVTVTHRPIAGEDDLILFCNTQDSFDLISLLDTVVDDFGNWQTSNGVVTSSLVDPSVDSSDVYQYVVSTTSPVCPSDTSFFDVTVQVQNNAGEDSSMVICSGTPLFDMTDVLLGSPDDFGTWYYDDVPVSSIFNAQIMPDGLYTYIVESEAPCVNTSAVLLLSDNTYDHTVVAADVSCPDYSDGEIAFYINGGVSPFEYSIDGGTTYQYPNLFEELQSGDYALSIRDGNNCLVVDSVTLTPPGSPIEVISNSLDVICPGETDALVLIESVVGGFPSASGYTYSWFHSDTDDLIGESASLSVGVGGYYVIVRDSMGCMGTSSQEVVETDAFEYNIIKEDVTCYGGNDATIFVEMLGGGSGDYSYDWLTTGDDVPVLYQQIAGDYVLEVTDTYGCSEQITVNVSGPSSALEATALAINPVSCYGDHTGLAEVVVEGGALPYTYYWSSGHVTDTAQHLASGTHSVIVTDASGCQDTASINITSGSEITPTISTVPADCYGVASGSADITTIGGTGSLEYTWSTGSTFTAITGLSHGDYWVIITDESGCSVTETAHISEPSPLLVTATPTDVLCFGDSNGSLSSSIEGGNAPYNYKWLHAGQVVSTAPSVSGQAASDSPYQLEITDDKGCVGTGFAFVSEPAVLTVATSQLHPAYCQDVATAEVGVIAAGGFLNTDSDYNYQWTTNWDDTLAVLSDQLAGDYTVAVTDDNACETIHTVNIPLIPTFHVSSITSESTRCYDESTGETSVSVAGGFSPYTYDWSWYSGTASNQQVQAAASSVQQNLPAGMVSVTIVDGNGCILDDQVLVGEPTELLYGLDKVQNQSCHGTTSSCDGEISISATGGTGDYEYTWSNLFNTPIGSASMSAADTNTITGLCAGFYYLSINDSLGCVGYLVDSEESNPVQIIEGQEVSASIDIDHIANNTVCYGDQAINMEVLNPNPLFDYDWYVDGVYQLTASAANNLPAGVVIVEATMNDHCATNSASVLTSEPAAIVPAAIISSPSCNGLSDGQLAAEVVGGVHPLTHEWIGLSDTNSVAAGNYSLVITDANACQSDTLSISVSEPAVLVLATTTSNALCYGTSTGAATVSISGGTAPYTENWGGANPSALSQGAYTVTVVDANTCEQTANVSISQPSNLTASINLTDDQMSASANGGVPAYNYVWEYYGNQQGTGNSLTAVEEGLYTLVVTDANGCQAQDTQQYERDEETAIAEEAVGVQLYPNPMTTQLTVVLDKTGNTPYDLQLIDARGRIVQAHRFTQSITLQRDQLAEGIYMLQIVGEGQIYNEKIVVKAP